MVGGEPHWLERGFYASLPVVSDFGRLSDPASYTPLPQDWVVGLSDVVQSTAAIEAGRYKAVNTAGAAVIAAVANALGSTSGFPFVFGGDGASFALPSRCEAVARDALAATAAWVRDDLDLRMRTALVPVDAIRRAGLDVRVARFAPSPNVSYAMFDGGGLAFADRQMKDGFFAVDPAPPGTRPDLTGLSCRFEEIKAERGLILSLIVVPVPGADPARFRSLTDAIVILAKEGVEAHRPVPKGGPPLRWPPAGLGLEARTARAAGRSLPVSLLVVGWKTLLAFAVFKAGKRLGAFDPARYIQQLVENTDFRKFDDGLRLTLDCSPALAATIEARLEEARSQGIARFGVYRQTAALMTCFVPSPTSSDHIHFVDGASGGYALAARALKASMAAGETRAT